MKRALHVVLFGLAILWSSGSEAQAGLFDVVRDVIRMPMEVAGRVVRQTVCSARTVIEGETPPECRNR